MLTYIDESKNVTCSKNVDNFCSASVYTVTLPQHCSHFSRAAYHLFYTYLVTLKTSVTKSY